MNTYETPNLSSSKKTNKQNSCIETLFTWNTACYCGLNSEKGNWQLPQPLHTHTHTDSAYLNLMIVFNWI